jgi:IclR family KDG regulon transcriptional repressor
MTARRATPQSEEDANKYSIRVVGRTIEILNIFSGGKNKLSLDEITKETGLSKPTVFRILSTLQHYKYVVLDPIEGRYRLGSVFLALGAAALGSVSLKGIAKPHLASLRDELQTTVLVGTIMDDMLVYLDKVECAGPVRIAADIGLRRDPPNFGMLGMTLMAYLDDGEAQRLLGRAPLTSFTGKSIVTKRDYLDRLQEIRAQGYAVEFGEAIEGVWGVGAPIRNSSTEVVAAVGAALPMSSKSEARVKEVVAKMLSCAAAISADLGFRARRV